MSEHSVFLVDYNDIRFDAVLEVWAFEMDKAANKIDNIEKYKYFDTIMLQHHNHLDPSEQVNGDIRYIIKHLRKGEQFMQMIAYPESYVSELELQKILAVHHSRRKKKDYYAYMMSAAELTFRLDEKLLDNQIPNINVIVIEKH